MIIVNYFIGNHSENCPTYINPNSEFTKHQMTELLTCLFWTQKWIPSPSIWFNKISTNSTNNVLFSTILKDYRSVWPFQGLETNGTLFKFDACWIFRFFWQHTTFTNILYGFIHVWYHFIINRPIREKPTKSSDIKIQDISMPCHQFFSYIMARTS